MGMILIPSASGVSVDACPHTHGDDPTESGEIAEVGYLSPHALG